MITKLIYFRPDKRFVKEDILDKKYSCVIQDEINKSQSSITVPRYLTLIQYFNNPKLHHQRKKKNAPEFLEKLSFHLVGSAQVPQMEQLVSNVELIDRIEFHGHIGFDEPVFAAMKQLPELKKVTFFLIPCKQEEFTKVDEEDSKENGTEAESVNRWVTSLKIVLEKFCLDAECNNCKAVNISSTKEVLESMIIQILKRSKEQFPNIKRLTLDIPNWERLRENVDAVVNELKSLKPTTVAVKNDRIIVQKTSDIPAPVPEPESVQTEPIEDISTVESNPPECPPEVPVPTEDRMSPFPQLMTTISNPATQSHAKQAWTRSSPNKTKPNLVEVFKDNSSGNSDGISPDGQPCLGLVDMSKLLGSMLGIPSSASLGCPASSLGQSLSHPQSSTKLPLSNQNPSNANIMMANNPNPTPKPPPEVISYAAAAASNNKLALSRHLQLRGTGNDSHQNYSSSIGNEASKRTFFFEGAKPPPNNAEDSSGKRNSSSHSHHHHANPSIAISADLGKPVFNGTNITSSTRHIKA